MRLRLYVGAEIALGPGKADLLASVHETGSIAQAAQNLGMSYMRAWTLVRTMNDCFTSPLIETARGGASGGRACLTPAGLEVLSLYRTMTAEGLRAASPAWKKLRRRLRG
jgi:molybdate transport system regulatory protein